MGRKHALIGAQAAVTVVLLWIIFRRLDIRAFGAVFTSLPVWYYVLSLVVVLGGQVLYAWRWHLLLEANGIRLRFRAVVRQYFIGIFLNNFLPSTVGGDVAKVYYLGRGHGYRPIAASVVLDRLLGIGLLALLSAALLWRGVDVPPVVSVARGLVTAIAAAVVLVLVVAVRGTGGLPQRVARLGPRFVGLAARLQRFRLDMAAAATQPVILIKALGVVCAYFLALAFIYETFVALNGLDMPTFVDLLAAVTAATVLSNIPVSLNGLGLREQLHVALLLPLGVPREAAVAISLLLYAHRLAASLCGLVFWLRAPAVAPGPDDADGASQRT